MNLDLVGGGSVALSRHFPQKEWLIFLHQELLKVESRILRETANHPKGSFLFRSQCKQARSKLNCATWPKSYPNLEISNYPDKVEAFEIVFVPPGKAPGIPLTIFQPFSESLSKTLRFDSLVETMIMKYQSWFLNCNPPLSKRLDERFLEVPFFAQKKVSPAWLVECKFCPWRWRCKNNLITIQYQESRS